MRCDPLQRAARRAEVCPSTVVDASVLLVGHGKMGRLVGELAPEYGCEVAGVIDPLSPRHGGGPTPTAGRRRRRDRFLDRRGGRSTNAPALARRGINLVVGTTGWAQHEAALRQAIARAGVGIVVAPNFSTGVVLFEAIVAHAARLFAAAGRVRRVPARSASRGQEGRAVGHGAAAEARDGAGGFPRPIDVSSTRAGFIPGTHTVGFDGPAETITLTHAARDRTAFARGALAAAQWVRASAAGSR